MSSSEELDAVYIVSRIREFATELLDHNGQTWDALHGRSLLNILDDTDGSNHPEDLILRMETWRKRAEAAEAKIFEALSVLNTASIPQGMSEAEFMRRREWLVRRFLTEGPQIPNGTV